MTYDITLFQSLGEHFAELVANNFHTVSDVLSEHDGLQLMFAHLYKCSFLNNILLSLVGFHNIVVNLSCCFQLGQTVHLFPSMSNKGVLLIVKRLRNFVELLELKLDDLFSLVHGLVKMIEWVIGERNGR